MFTNILRIEGVTERLGAGNRRKLALIWSLVPLLIPLLPGIWWRLSGILVWAPDASIGAEHFLMCIIILGRERVTLFLGAGNQCKLAPIWSPVPFPYTPISGNPVAPEWHTS